jgi:thiamine-monophosphate kinase
MHEFELIKKYFKPLTKNNKLAQNLADDVAKIEIKKDEELVVSKDCFVEDVHFLQRDGGFKIASKLLRVNLSDLAAAGATPLYYLLGFSKNKKTDEKFISEFARGLKSVQDEFNLVLIGGDTVNSDKLFFSVTIFGAVKKGKILSRNQAKPGDLIFVSGTIGDASIGLKGSKEKYFLDRHFFPTPRIELGKELLKQNLSKCAIDVSDGLLADLRHVCEESKLTAEIHLEKIPISSSKSNVLDLISAGDDYELVFTTAKNNSKKISALAKKLKLKLTCIGEMKKMQKNSPIILLNKNLQEIKIKKFGYEHS